MLDWLLHTERLRFLQGILWLRQLNGTTYVRPAPSPPVARQFLTDLDDDGQALLHLVIGFYHRNLPDNEGAQAWLASRAMADHMIMKGSARHLYLPLQLAGIWNEAAYEV